MIKFKLSLLLVFVFAIQNISFSQANIDFETGNLNGWTGYIGANMNSNVSFTACSTAVNPPLNGTNLNMIPKSYFSMMTTAAPADLYGGFSLTSPLGGLDVIRLGNENTNVNEGGDCTTPKNCANIGPPYCSTICGTPVGSSYIESPAEAIEQTFAVTSANALLTYAWAAVLNDGGHPVGEEPYFEVKIFNGAGVEQTCFTNRVIQKTGITSPGWTKSATKNCWYGSSPAMDVYYKSWTTVNCLLTNYIGQNVKVRFAVAGCVDGGHFGYAYWDAKTGPAAIIPSNVSPCGTQTITLSAPAGVTGPYSWTGPGVVSGASTATVTVNAAGTYTLSVGTGTCTATMTASVTYSGGPSVTASAGSPTVCANQSVVLTAGGATTYTWSANAGSATTSTVSVSPGTTTIYTVTGTTAGCTGTQTVAVNVTPTPTITLSGTTNICSGQSTILTASTSAGTFTWSANAGSATTNTVSVNPGLGTTIYTVSGTNSGCPGSNTISVTVSATPTLGISGTTSICSGNAVVLTGTTTAGTYTWSANAGSATTSTVSVNPGGTTTYTLNGTNGVCTNSTTITVTVTPTPTLTVNNPNICSGQSVILTAATANTYTWSTTATTNTISVTPPVGTTTYTVTGDNGNGCTVTKTATVTVNATPTVSISGSLNHCSGTPVVLTGATAANYTWSANAGGATTSTVSVNPGVGTTTYTLTGANGACTATAVATVTLTATPTLTVNNASICSGQSAVLTAATANTYTWSTTATTNTISVTPPVGTNTYSVVGDNGNGCTVTVTATVTVNSTPTVSISGAASICSGTTLILTGATATNYTWLPGGQNTSTISITPPSGTTTYTLIGANGVCTATTTAFVDVTPTPTVVATSTVICSGQTVVLTGSGASTYTWSANAGSANTNTVSVNPGTTTVYTVTGTATSCTNVATATVTVNPTPTLTFTSNSYTICAGNSTGISAGGASTYTWTSGTGLSCTVCPNPNANPGTTTVYTVTGSNGSCLSAAATVTVNVNALPTIIITPSSTTLCSSSSSTLTAGGATSYTWSPGGSLSSSTGTTVTATPTTTTTYTVVGSDANGCNNTDNVTITVSPTPTISISSVPPAACSGQSVVLNGGTATTYTWSANAGGVNTSTVSVTPSSNTTYTLSGSIGSCTASAVATVTVNPLPVIGSSTTTPAPCGQSTGCVDSVFVNNGTPTYQYSWDNGVTWSNSSQHCGVPAGNYTVEVIDQNGCTTSQVISVANINGPSAPTVAASSTVVCVGGNVTLSITSPSVGITYTWTDNTGIHTGTTYTITNIAPPGNYPITITATDINGCISAATTANITVNPLPVITVAASAPAICSGQSTILTASGATTYTWSANAGSATTNTVSINPTGNTTYTVMGTNAGGCNDTTTIAITVNPTPTVAVNAASGNICSGQSTVLSASGASNFTWTPGGLTTNTISVSPTVNTTYTVTGDNLGCTSTQTVSVNVTANPTLTAVASQTAICSGQTATLTATGATNYTWTPGGTGGTISVTPTGNTTYTVTGANGNCVTTETVSVNVTPTPNVTLASSSPAICAGQTATLTASGATNYTWMPTGSTGTTFTDNPISTTVYTVSGDNAGCTGTQTISVTVNQLPVLSSVGNQTVCGGTLVSAINYAVTGTTTVNWNNTNTNVGIGASGSGNIAGYTAPIVATQQVGVITAIPTDNGTGCVGSSQTYTVVVNPSPTVSGGNSDTAKCGASNGGVNGINVSGGTPIIHYQWYNGSTPMTNDTLPILPGVAGGTYSVLITDANGCVANGTTTIFTVPATTAVVASITPPLSQGQAPLNVTFTNNTTGATIYGWNFGNGTSSSSPTPGAATYNTPGTYTVILFASNVNGCLDADTAIVIIDAPVNIIVPNIYSPNGDGINDDFFITCTGIRDLRCDIFNRWGQLIYQLLAPNDKWNGVMNNGNTASDGTYFYVLDAVGFDGKEYKSHGALTLVK